MVAFASEKTKLINLAIVWLMQDHALTLYDPIRSVYLAGLHTGCNFYGYTAGCRLYWINVRVREWVGLDNNTISNLV